MVDAASYGLRVIYSAQGGVEIEQSGAAQGRSARRIRALWPTRWPTDRRRTGGMARSDRGDRQGAGTCC